MVQHDRDVRVVPKADSCTAAKRASYSITSSAMESTPAGIVRPSVFAGFEVDDQLEFGGLEDWQVGGLRALEDLTGVDADLTPHLVIIRPIAHQPASFGLFASGKVAGIR